jgi:hypothetical protein
MQPIARIAESPWFYALIFSMMGLIAIGAIGRKYDTRQATIERQYQARERVAERLTAENNSGSTARLEGRPADQAYRTPGGELVQIWPLAVLLGLVAVVSAIMLERNLWRPA